ncbi:MAG: hypothetical protein LBQ42_01105, partial [Synergistaceae bacterium]|nr:hypothetical protein [Synergistaceae bacterium]
IVNREIKKLASVTENTITDKETFLKELAVIRARDYAISYGEREDGIISVAVPILDRHGNAACALSLAGPALRFTEERALALVPELQRICAEISHLLFA